MRSTQSGGAEEGGNGHFKGDEADTCNCCKYHLFAKYNNKKDLVKRHRMDLSAQSKAENHTFNLTFTVV